MNTVSHFDETPSSYWIFEFQMNRFGCTRFDRTRELYETVAFLLDTIKYLNLCISQWKLFQSIFSPVAGIFFFYVLLLFEFQMTSIFALRSLIPNPLIRYPSSSSSISSNVCGRSVVSWYFWIREVLGCQVLPFCGQSNFHRLGYLVLSINMHANAQSFAGKEHFSSSWRAWKYLVNIFLTSIFKLWE